jgi:hypothetical protein
LICSRARHGVTVIGTRRTALRVSGNRDALTRFAGIFEMPQKAA